MKIFSANNFCLSNRFLMYFILISVCMGFFISGCQNPVLKYTQPPSDRMIFTENVNYSRNNFTAADFPFPLKLNQEESINGVTTPHIGLFENHVFLTTINGYLSIIPATDIDDNRKTRPSKGIKASATLYGNTLYIPMIEGDAGLKTYDITTGESIWQLERNYSESSPVVMDNLVYHATREGKILCLNAETGEKVWQTDLDDAIYTNLILVRDYIAAVSQIGLIRVFDPATGLIRISEEIGDYVYAQAAAAGSNLYILSYRGILYKLNLDNGRLTSITDFQVKSYAAPASDGERLIISLSDGQLVGMNLSDHRELWRIETKGPASCPPLLTNGHVVIGTSQRYIYIMNKESGAILQTITLEGRLSAPPVIVNPEQVIMTYEYNKIASFDAAGVITHE